MANFVGANAVLKKTKRVFLHTGTANEGYGVCYNWDAVGVTGENIAFNTVKYDRAMGTTIGDWADARRVMVEIPTKWNNQHFAGVVDEVSDGVVGPNWIEIHEPGSICKIHSLAIVTLGAVASQNEYRLQSFSIGQHGGKYTSGEAGGVFDGAGAALCLAELSTADGLVMARLSPKADRPSGGVASFATAEDLGGAATDSRTNLAVGGWTILSLAGCFSEDSLLSLADGDYEGERIGIECSATLSDDGYVVISGIGCTKISADVCVEPMDFYGLGYRTSAALSAANDFIVLEWFGDRWWVLGCNAAILSA